MLGFFIKKAFFDGWDNLISLVLVNLLFVALLAAGYGAFSLLGVNVLLGGILLLAWFAALHLAFGGASYFTKEHAFYQRPGFAEFWQGIKSSWRSALLLAAVNAVVLMMFVLVMPFYMGLDSVLGIAIVAILFWIVIVTMISMIYFLPISAQLGDRPLKAMKKSYLIFLDNTGFSIFLFLYTIILFVISIFTALLVPSGAGILLSHEIALKLLMFKYDYLEENPEADRKHLPWGGLLFDERDKVGHRTLKGMIFPWKD